MQALVTGAAGFIGSRLARRLLDDGWAVRGVDRFSDFYDVARKRASAEALAQAPAFELVEGDLTELDLAPLVADADAVFHLAAQPGVRSSWGDEFDVYLRDNLLATQRLLEAMAARGSGRFVFASSSSVYGDAERYPTAEDAPTRPRSPYGVTKLGCEHLARLYGDQHAVDCVVLRYFTIFGPGQRPDMAFARFIEAGLENRELEVLGDGLQSRDFTFVEDAVAATVAAFDAGSRGGVYNVSGGTHATVLDVIAALEGLLERELGVHHRPPAAGDVRRTGADTSRAGRELGYSPRVSLEEGLRLQLEARLAVPGGSDPSAPAG